MCKPIRLRMFIMPSYESFEWLAWNLYAFYLLCFMCYLLRSSIKPVHYLSGDVTAKWKCAYNVYSICLSQLM